MVIDHDSEAGRFITQIEGHEAVLDYTLSKNVMNITHTGVPPAIAGRGIAAELMRAALAFANAQGLSVNPACSYAAAYLRKYSGDA